MLYCYTCIFQITHHGEVVDEPTFRFNTARKEHRTHVRELMSQAVINKTLELEVSREGTEEGPGMGQEGRGQGWARRGGAREGPGMGWARDGPGGEGPGSKMVPFIPIMVQESSQIASFY